MDGEGNITIAINKTTPTVAMVPAAAVKSRQRPRSTERGAETWGRGHIDSYLTLS
jgi:hypothetical protein